MNTNNPPVEPPPLQKTKRKRLLFISFLSLGLLVLLFSLQFPAGNILSAALPKALPGLAENLHYESATLSPTGRLQLNNVAIQVDSIGSLTAKSIEINPELLPLLRGNIRLHQLNIHSLHLSIPKSSALLKEKWTKELLQKHPQILQLTPLFLSEFQLDTVTLSHEEIRMQMFHSDIAFVIEKEELKGNLEIEELTCLPQCPSLKNLSADLTLTPEEWALHNLHGSLWGGEFHGEMKGNPFHKIEGQVQFSKLKTKQGVQWLFPPGVQSQGTAKGELQFSTTLQAPLKKIQAKGPLLLEDFSIAGLHLQNSTLLQDFAPEFTQFSTSALQVEWQADHSSIQFTNLTGQGPQADFLGKGHSNWKSEFHFQLMMLLSKNSTDKLPPLTRGSLPKTTEGRAEFRLKLSGNPQTQQIDNFDDLMIDAVGENLKRVGESIFGLFN